MRKGFILTGIIFVSFLTLALFQVKYKVVELEDEIKDINREIFKVEESLHVLKAEWAYRTSPLRLNQLADQHLKMTTFSATQMESQETPEIPMEEALVFQAAYDEGGPN